MTSKYASLLFVLAVRDGSSPTLSKERGKTKLEYMDRDYFADTETGPLMEVKTWTRGWDSGVRRWDSCDHPEEHQNPPELSKYDFLSTVLDMAWIL